jgi:putative addiction module antidote
MVKLKVTTVGSSAGVVLPKELLARLRVGKGDFLFALESPNGIELTAYDPAVERQMELAEEVMREDREVLRRLAGPAGA